mgnify:CR=1 FL=1
MASVFVGSSHKPGSEEEHDKYIKSKTHYACLNIDVNSSIGRLECSLRLKISRNVSLQGNMYVKCLRSRISHQE